MTARYQPQVLWILMGPLVGALCGAAVGCVITLFVGLTSGDLLSDPAGFLAGLVALAALGLIFGGMGGAVVGFFAGLPLIFLVGRHLPRPVARRRAFVLGTVLSPLAMVVAFSVVSGEMVQLAFEGWWGLVPVMSASVLGGALAAAAAKADLPRPPAQKSRSDGSSRPRSAS